MYASESWNTPSGEENRVLTIDVATGSTVGFVSLPAPVHNLVVATDGLGYAGFGFYSGTIHEIDFAAQEVLRTIRPLYDSNGSYALEISPDDTYLYHGLECYVEVIHRSSGNRVGSLGRYPGCPALEELNPSGAFVYLSNHETNELQIYEAPLGPEVKTQSYGGFVYSVQAQPASD